MLQLSQTLVSLKQVVLRGVARHNEEKLPKVEADIVERKRHLTSAPWLALDPMVWPCQITDPRPVVSRAPGASALVNESSDSLPYASPTSSATPSIFSQDNSSTITVLTIPSPSIPHIVTSDYDAEKAGRRSDIEWEYKDMFLGKNAKVRQLSRSDANTLVGGADPKTLGFLAPPGAFPVMERKKRVTPRKTTELWGCADGPIPVPSAGGFVVVAPATRHRASRTTGKSFKIGSGMYHYKTLAKYVAEQTYRKKYEGMIFGSKFYTEDIRDQCSYDAWLEWKAERPAEERVLWVVG